MPREWYDKHSAAMIEDEETREFYFSILADRKPYFMKYIYSDLMRQYNSHVKKANRKAAVMFSTTVDELVSRPAEDLSEDEAAFVHFYNVLLPVSNHNCVTNRICRRFEEIFDNLSSTRGGDDAFDRTILKTGVGYTRTYYEAVENLIKTYGDKLVQKFTYENSQSVRVDASEEFVHDTDVLKEELLSQCLILCNNEDVLCDIVVDVCYGKGCHCNIAWTAFGELIVDCLTRKNNCTVSLPVRCEDGDIWFGGETFSMKEFEVDLYW